MTVTPYFESLFKPIMEERTLNDRIQGSLFMMRAIQAQINAILLTMNQDFLVLMNITLFKEDIYKSISPTGSQ